MSSNLDTNKPIYGYLFKSTHSEADMVIFGNNHSRVMDAVTQFGYMLAKLPPIDNRTDADSDKAKDDLKQIIHKSGCNFAAIWSDYTPWIDSSNVAVYDKEDNKFDIKLVGSSRGDYFI